MGSDARDPQMKRRWVEITVGILGALWLAAIAIELCSIAGLVDIWWRISAIVLSIAVFAVACMLLAVTNTRRPAGIDPNAARVNHTGMVPDEIRPGVLLPDGRPYGRRAEDDRAVIDRLSEVLEAEAAKRPGPAKTPSWAVDLMGNDEAIKAEMAHGNDDS